MAETTPTATEDLAAMYSVTNTAPITTMAMSIFFGTLTFVTVAITIRAWCSNNQNGIVAQQSAKRSTALDLRSLTSVYALSYQFTIMGLLMLYAYICEHHPPHPHGEKSYDRDEFFFLTALLIVVSLFTLKPNDPNYAGHALTTAKKGAKESSPSKQEGSVAEPSQSTEKKKEFVSLSPTSVVSTPTTTESSVGATGGCGSGVVAPVNDHNEVLNRDQTEEWKGWMQFMFLLYHYYHAEEVYNAIRIMITCYVWMTGFGNFSFFYLKADYSFVRVIQMLWRLNFLVVFLCLTQGTTYILYYICLLHTYFFLMVYVVMRIRASTMNYSKWGIRLKLAILALFIYLVWDVRHSGIFYVMHYPFLGQVPQMGAGLGAMWEWYFRSSLDHWSTFLGMVFALNFPITSLWYRRVEALPLWRHVLIKSIIGAVVAAAVAWWVIHPFSEGKISYNMTNAYFGCIPLLGYIYFRNITPWLRSHSLDALHQIGKTTLETYLMQHHIWLTSNAKSLLMIIPGWPKMNFLLVTIIYFVVSRRLFQITLYVRGMILPDDRAACLRNIAGFIFAILSCVLLAFLLNLVQMLNLYTVATFSIGFGMILYKTIIDMTWETYCIKHGCAGDATATKTNHSNRWPSCSPAILSAIVILAIGQTWHHMARVGSTKITKLPRQPCESYVNDGVWVPIDTCGEGNRGFLQRESGITNFGTCPMTDTIDDNSPSSTISSNLVWGWKKATPSSSSALSTSSHNEVNQHCRFIQRNSKSLAKTLDHRRIVYVGDSIMRNLYQSLRRQLGDWNAGQYNTTMGKWQDFANSYKNDKIQLEFKWAPYSQDMLTVLKSLRQAEQMAAQAGKGSDDQATYHKPDLIVMGGGAWDRLHKYQTKQEQDDFAAGVAALTKEMGWCIRQQQIPVAWVIPTTISTWALPTEEKRSNIREEDLVQIRQIQHDAGLAQGGLPSFVLDGRAFTRDRVSESYDGVHYPLHIYDAGTQILVNAMDWLLAPDMTVDPIVPPKPGKMANPYLGAIMLGFVFIGLFMYDGFMGLTYLTGLVMPSLLPAKLHDEAFTDLHRRKHMPPLETTTSLTRTAWLLLCGCFFRGDTKKKKIISSADSENFMTDTKDDASVDTKKTDDSNGELASLINGNELDEAAEQPDMRIV